MARTQVRTQQVEDGGITRDDLNTADTGKAVARKVIQGTGVSLSSTGVDAGTGDVTVNTTAADASNPGHVSTGTQELAGRKTYKNQYLSEVHDLGNLTGTINVDWDNGNFQKGVLTGNTTFTFSNPQGGGRYFLEIDTGAGSFTLTWPTIVWMTSAGAAPVVPTAASKVCSIGLAYSGSRYTGSYGDNS